MTPKQKIKKLESAMALSLAAGRGRIVYPGTNWEEIRPRELIKHPWEIDPEIGRITDECRYDAMAKSERCCVGGCDKAAKIKIRPNFANNNSLSSRYPGIDMCKQVIAYLSTGSRAFGFCLDHQTNMFDSLHNSFKR